MVAGKSETRRSFKRKGFGEVLGGAHVGYEYVVDGVKIASTYVSHGGSGDLGDDLISDMAKGCRLSRKEFLAFAKCEMSEAEYRAILIRKGLIPGP
jgi:hypothetical protein